MPTPEFTESEEMPILSDVKFMRPVVVAAIERALCKVGAFGEVHLIVERGHLRFIRTIRSEAIDRAKG